MKLLIFDDKNSWITIDGEFKVKVDYCNLKQQMRLDKLLQDYIKTIDSDKSESDSTLFHEYAATFVKYHLKDWKGVSDGKKDLALQLVDGEMEDKLWIGLVNNTIAFWKIYNVISEKMRFNEIDKKK